MLFEEIIVEAAKVDGLDVELVKALLHIMTGDQEYLAEMFLLRARCAGGVE